MQPHKNKHCNRKQSLNTGECSTNIRHSKYHDMIKQQNINTSIHQTLQNYDQKLQNKTKAIGIIRSVWKNRKGQIVAINYGTGFALNKRIVLTCTHNIFSQNKFHFCSEVTFYPSVINSISQENGYRTINKKFYQCLTPNRSFSYQPLKEELCLIVLERNLQIDSFISIGNINYPQNKENQHKISIVGYPSKQYQKQSYFNIQKLKVQRKQHSGNIHSIKQNIIHYTNKTECGQSGSPVLCRQHNGNWKAIGLHTHRGLQSQYNSGVYFNNNIIELIKQFQQEIKQDFDIEESIRYECSDTSCLSDQSQRISNLEKSEQQSMQIDSSDDGSQLNQFEQVQDSFNERRFTTKLDQSFQNYKNQQNKKNYENLSIQTSQLLNQEIIDSPRKSKFSKYQNCYHEQKDMIFDDIYQQHSKIHSQQTDQSQQQISDTQLFSSQTTELETSILSYLSNTVQKTNKKASQNKNLIFSYQFQEISSI